MTPWDVPDRPIQPPCEWWTDQDRDEDYLAEMEELQRQWDENDDYGRDPQEFK